MLKTIKEMLPGEALDSLVAKTVFGFRKIKVRQLKTKPTRRFAFKARWVSIWVDDNNTQLDLPKFSTDVIMAHHIIDSVNISVVMKKTVKGKYSTKFGKFSTIQADSMPESVCKAALIAFYEEEQEDKENQA